MKQLASIAIAVMFALLVSVHAQSIVINEVMASNKDVIFDADFHQSSDWIELYNSGLTAVPLDGYFLTDDPNNLQKWRILNTVIGPNQYLLIWADGADLIEKNMHTNFKLNASGEWLALVSPLGSIVDSLRFGRQYADISFGREADHLFKIGYFESPTPGAANRGDAFLSEERCSAPILLPQSGYYSSLSVSAKASDADAIVRYTVDGSVPTPESPILTTPVPITNTTVFRARSFSDKRLASEIVTRTYIVGYRSQLPVVSLATMPRNMWSSADGIYVDQNISSRKEWERFGAVEIIPPDNSPSYSFEADYRLFGRTAIYLPQKSFAFFADSPVEYPLFPNREKAGYKSFILRSASDDWDNMMFSDAMEQLVLERFMNIETQAYQPAVLFINGEYFGIHNLREKYNEDYFEYHYGVPANELDLVLVDYRNDQIEATVGSAQGFLDLLDYAHANDMSDPQAYQTVLSQIDLDNYLDYIVAESYVGNVSWSHNIRVWRSPKTGNRWRWVLFDLDRGMLDSGYAALASMLSNDRLLRELVANSQFKQALAERFLHHLNTTFQTDAMISMIDSVSALIADEMPNHIERWAGVCGNNVCGISSMDFWQGELERRREFARQRPAILMQQVTSALNVGQTVQLNLRVEPAGSGLIQLNGGTTIHENYDGIFLAGSQQELVAIPADGYAFDGWYQASTGQQTLIPRGSVWFYWDEGTSPGTSWNAPGFDDSGWKSGPGQLGYGDGDEATVISYGGDAQNKYLAYWFRHHFTVSNRSAIDSLHLELQRDDGAIVYINGVEVVRSNMPEGPVDENTTSASVTNNENAFRSFDIDKSVLLNGENVIAVEVHQTSHTSSDVSFDLELTAKTSDSSDQLVSGSEQYNVTPQQDLSLIARFRLDAAHSLPAMIDGSLSLTASGSPYVAETTITVQPGAELILEPGARFLLSPSASLIVKGKMLALGTADAPIVIESLSPTESWGGISIVSADDTVRFSHVTIRGATTPGTQSWQTAAVSAENAHLVFDHVRILECNDPFALHSGSIRMNACELDGTNANDDILHVVQGMAVIENCLLYGDSEVDFDVADNSIIRGNKIVIQSTNSNQDAVDIGTGSKNVLIEGNTLINAPDKGASIGEGSSAVIRRNVFINCNTGVGIKDNSYADIINNTFYRNIVGINLYEKNAGQGGGSAVVTNSIFYDSQEKETKIDDKSNIVVTYSLSNTSKMFGINNINEDPMFVDAAHYDFHLVKGSPAIDAGDPASPKDPDGTRADIGAFYYDSSPKSFSIRLNELCPNNKTVAMDPANEYEDWVELYNPSDSPFDLTGFYMTDDLNNPGKWQITSAEPNLASIPAKGVLVIWMDNDMNQEGMHAPFKLNAAGEEVGLYYIAAGDTIEIDAVKYDAIGEDKSLARLPDGTGEWILTERPTPGQLNANVLNVVKDEKMPTEFALLQNYPNPFNPQTMIRFDLPEDSAVRIEIMDVLGRTVKTFESQRLSAGRHHFVWDARDNSGHMVSAGLYFYRFTAGAYVDVKKMLLVK